MKDVTIEIKRHSLSHILAMAVLELFPSAKLGIGPAIENGFYYDFDLERSILPTDLPEIERRMYKILNKKFSFCAKNIGISDAKKLFSNQPYKLELIEEIDRLGEKEVGVYYTGDFFDLCKGPHIESTSEILPKSFKLSHSAGAYWRGSEKNPMLQRIYGLAFDKEDELIQYIQQQEDAKKRDHRVLGPQLGIYMLSEEVGAGLPLWLPNGETIKHLLQEYMRKKEELRGYKYVSTPVFANEELYNRSGHTKYYADEMYNFKDKEGSSFYVKPMNCPHHHMIYEKMVTSYRDLPLKLAEAGGIYRHELSGTLTGLIRVRGAITQNDSHIYVSPNQVKKEFLAVLDLFKEVYAEMKIEGYWFRLSLPDFELGSNKYGGERQKWEDASSAIREALIEFGAPFVEVRGEAAFYGPKVDVQIKNVTGKEDTIATCQVDILVAKRMGLVYVDQNGQEQNPIIIHRAILGSYERFTAFLIEQTAGNLPFWLAPVQINIISVSDKFNEVSLELQQTFIVNGIRAEVDISGESVSKKIRNSSLMKIPLKIVIGQDELDYYIKNKKWKVKVNWRSDFEREMKFEQKKEYQISDLLVLIEDINKAK